MSNEANPTSTFTNSRVDATIRPRRNGMQSRGEGVRERGTVVLSRIDAAADDSVAGDVVSAGTAALRRDFQLSTDPMERIADSEDGSAEMVGTTGLEPAAHGALNRSH